jgi:alkanesulfonate monooxygenase SsuD/methylene tetrahydromethanopterin reductase-like flavin-dependent oxidoreductase (luciferase family)
VVAAWALCADTDEEATRVASSSRMAFVHFLAGELIPVPPIDTAVRFLTEHEGAEDALARRRRAIVGSPDTVKAKLESLAAAYRAEEVMVVTITYEHAARRRSYELLAAACGLSRT